MKKKYPDPIVLREFVEEVSTFSHTKEEYLDKLQQGNQYHYKQGADDVMLMKVGKGIVKMFKYLGGVVSEVITITYSKTKGTTYTSDQFHGMEIPPGEVDAFLEARALTSQTGKAMTAKKRKALAKVREERYNRKVVEDTNQYWKDNG